MTTVPIKFSLSLLTLLACAASLHGAVIIDYVIVGDAGNAADTTGYGAVAYSYRIGKYEVTNAQYAEFLNNTAASDPNGLYNSSMGSDARGGITQSGTSGSFTYAVKANMGDKPVNYVSIADAMRFTNWINNGQGAATTESGAYDMTQSLSTVVHNGSANVWLPTENEWYKAAYYQPQAAGGDTDSYWLYATQSNTIPSVGLVDANGNITNDGDNVANYSNGAVWNSLNGNVTTVGSAGATSDSFYGAYDLGGNVREWNEAIISSNRGLRGGGWDSSENGLRASYNISTDPEFEDDYVGFRLASSVPEPSRMMLSLAGVCSLFLRRRRLPSDL
jgi:formylglycine-generating enzyme required for sulfatase activity